MFTPLAGIRVLDFSQYMTEAVGGHFADLGAEVIKVEAPPVGSLSRPTGGYMPQMARGKKSLAINLKLPEAVEAFMRIAKESHVIIDGLRAGALEGLGLGYEDVKKVNPAIVFLSISGWGQSGPYRRLATHGQGFDTFSALEPVAWEDGLPNSVRQAVGEVAAQVGCFYATVGGIAAVRQAEKTGKGVQIDVSEGMAGAWLHWSALMNLVNGNQRPAAPAGNVGRSTRYHVYPTKDHKAVYLMAIEQKFWVNFAKAAGRPELAARGDWSRGLDNGGYPGEYEELVEIFRAKNQDEWMKFFLENDVAGAPANSLESLIEDKHFQSWDPWVTVTDARLGTQKILGTPINVKGETFTPGNPPALGEHTDALLSSAGYSKADIEGLRAAKAVQ